MMPASSFRSLIAFPSTAASYFHLLRRQAYARPRTPLVVFTPKSMLRSKAAASPVEAFTQNGFQPVLADHDQHPPLREGDRRASIGEGVGDDCDQCARCRHHGVDVLVLLGPPLGHEQRMTETSCRTDSFASRVTAFGCEVAVRSR